MAQSTSRETTVSLVPESETRIVSYVDNRVGSVDKRIDELGQTLTSRLDKQDVVLDRIVDKADRQNDLWMQHITAEGHPVTVSKVETLSKEVSDLEGKPWKVWQWVAGVAGVTLMLFNFIITMIYLFHNLIH